jgi:hypothetical protein
VVQLPRLADRLVRPWLFTADGTVIDGLTYGRLGKGRHTIEYRATDPSGNTGKPGRFTVTLR